MVKQDTFSGNYPSNSLQAPFTKQSVTGALLSHYYDLMRDPGDQTLGPHGYLIVNITASTFVEYIIGLNIGQGHAMIIPHKVERINMWQ